jgi:hypothetical protein
MDSYYIFKKEIQLRENFNHIPLNTIPYTTNSCLNNTLCSRFDITA